MRLIVRSVKLRLDQEEEQLPGIVARKLGVRPHQIKNLEIVRKSWDARRDDIRVVYNVEIDLDTRVVSDKVLQAPGVSVSSPGQVVDLQPGDRPLRHSPVVVGTGPAGLFCALALARAGYQPVVLERGQDVDRRVNDVDRFWQSGKLNPESNVQFGEGGAGTFSDGKLTTRIGDSRVAYVLDTLVSFGAPAEIRYLKKPHVGTDRLREIVKAIRSEILSLGGKVYFSACVTDLAIENGILRGIMVNNSGALDCSQVVLAVGNSARDMFRNLHRHGIPLTSKGFAVGVRIEHPQDLIDIIQYGENAGHPKLGPADYHLTYHDPETGRAFYTFCMCPGGQVIAAASNNGQVVTNGMSCFNRDSGLANSALVVSVPPQTLDSHPLAGVEFQERLEGLAFEAGGGNYQAPVQMVRDFLESRESSQVSSTYRPGQRSANLWEVLPFEICGVIARGLKEFDHRMPGFAGPEAVLVGVETRTSSPLRIERNPELNSINCEGLYPCGEGAGYAGGIVSSAVDGLKVAEKIIQCFSRPQQSLEVSAAGIIDARGLGGM